MGGGRSEGAGAGVVIQQTSQHTKIAIDAAAGAAAMSVPIWLQEAQTWLAFSAAALGVVLVLVRILIGIQEFRANRRKGL